MPRHLVLLSALGSLVLGVACDRPRATPAEQQPPVPSPMVAKPSVPTTGPTELRKDPAPRPLTELEQSLAGTWVAKVGPGAPHSAAMHDKVMLQTQPGKGLVGGVIDAVEHDRRVSTGCIWLELYDNLRGFRNECALIGDEPQALQQHDVATGAAQPFGVSLSWRVDGRLVHITYDAPMQLPVGEGGATKEFRQTTLELQAGSDPVHELVQAFPEHPEIPGTTRRFEIMSGSYL